MDTGARDLGHSTQWTYADWLNLPDGGYGYEVINGELIHRPVFDYRWITSNLLIGIAQHLSPSERREGLLGDPPGIFIAEDCVLVPDLVYMSPGRRKTDGKNVTAGTPAFVCEVVSASTRERDLGIKRDLYAQHGVPEYWTVDPDDQTVTVLSDPQDGTYVNVNRLTETEQIYSPVFGWRLNVAQVLADPLAGDQTLVTQASPQGDQTDWAYDDWLMLPDEDCYRYEVIGGALVRLPLPPPRYGQVMAHLLGNIYRLLDPPTGLYPGVGVRLADHTVLVPDLMYVRPGRRHLVGEYAVNGAPNFVCEVLSSGTVSLDRITKRDLYAQHEVDEYWLADPDTRTIVVHSEPSAVGYVHTATFTSDDVLRSPLFGHELPVGKLFPKL